MTEEPNLGKGFLPRSPGIFRSVSRNNPIGSLSPDWFRGQLLPDWFRSLSRMLNECWKGKYISIFAKKIIRGEQCWILKSPMIASSQIQNINPLWFILHNWSLFCLFDFSAIPLAPILTALSVYGTQFFDPKFSYSLLYVHIKNVKNAIILILYADS